MEKYKVPGQHKRIGISLTGLFRMFPDDETAERWFIEQRWGDEIACVRCGSCNVLARSKHPTMPHRCRDCGKQFSVKLGTVMEASKLGYQVWAIAVYLMMTGIKGTSSMKLHRDLTVTQKTAWFLAHRIRAGLSDRDSWLASERKFDGPVEVDETFIGGRESNKHESKKRKAGRGVAGKAVIAGAKDRKTKQVRANVIPRPDRLNLSAFVSLTVKSGATLYTDENRSYHALRGRYGHETVNHGAGEYVSEEVHTNGLESFWSMFKRGFHGTYHKMSDKHLQRYVTEFMARHNVRSKDTMEQMERAAEGMEGKRLRYRDLIA